MSCGKYFLACAQRLANVGEFGGEFWLARCGETHMVYLNPGLRRKLDAERNFMSNAELTEHRMPADARRFADLISRQLKAGKEVLEISERQVFRNGVIHRHSVSVKTQCAGCGLACMVWLAQLVFEKEKLTATSPWVVPAVPSVLGPR